jgi:hypothetical protein
MGLWLCGDRLPLTNRLGKQDPTVIRSETQPGCRHVFSRHQCACYTICCKKVLSFVLFLIYAHIFRLSTRGHHGSWNRSLQISGIALLLCSLKAPCCPSMPRTRGAGRCMETLPAGSRPSFRPVILIPKHGMIRVIPEFQTLLMLQVIAVNPLSCTEGITTTLVEPPTMETRLPVS